MFKHIELREDRFDYILKNYVTKEVSQEEFMLYLNGKKQVGNLKIVCDDYIIVNNGLLWTIGCDVSASYGVEVPSWVHIVCRKCFNKQEITSKSLSPYIAEKKIKALLYSSGYDDVSIDAQLRKFQITEIDKSKQYHYIIPEECSKVIKYTNCIYYDINGAHCDALCEIFPNARKKLLQMYAKRKKDITAKEAPNFYIGRLGKWKDKKKGIPGTYRDTYNWIVDRTTKKLSAYMDEVMDYNNFKSTEIYSNTDGFIVQNPIKLLEESSELGRVKIESKGDVYFYRCYTNNDYSGWFAYQYIDKSGTKVLKGDIPQSMRQYVDLEKGLIVHFKIIKNPNGTRDYINIVNKTIEVEERR